MQLMDEKHGFLELGEAYPGQDGLLIGDEEGLKRLRQAIDVALEQGECLDRPLGEFGGVRMLPSEFFTEEPADDDGGSWACLMILLLFLILMAIFLIGLSVTITTLWHWIIE